MFLEKLTVGEKWKEAPEGCQIAGLPTGLILIISQKDFEEKEIVAANKEPIEVAIYEYPPIIMFVFRIKNSIGWSDCPISFKLYEGQDSVDLSWLEKPPKEGCGYPLQLVLLDLAGVVQALRFMVLPHKFSFVLHEMYLRQMQEGVSGEQYDKAIDEVFARFTSEELARQAAVRSWVGCE